MDKVSQGAVECYIGWDFIEVPRWATGVHFCLSCLLTGALEKGSPVKRAVEPTTLTQETAVAFVEECVNAWSKKDMAVWDNVVGGALFQPEPPSLLLAEQQTSNNLWTGSGWCIKGVPNRSGFASG